jgi:hypothetical protein
MILVEATLPVISELKYLLCLAIVIVPLLFGLFDYLAHFTVCTYGVLVRPAGRSTFLRTTLIVAMRYQDFSCPIVFATDDADPQEAAP